MKLDILIHKLLPTDNKFFDYLEQSGQNLVEASEALRTLMLTTKAAERDALVEKISDHEHRGDAITHTIFSELNSTFVTPLDREDIHKLASALDDILDFMDGSVARFNLYGLKRYPSAMGQLADILAKSIVEVRNGVHMLRNIHKSSEIQATLKKINTYENEADALFEKTVSELFAKEKNAIEIMKLKEVYVGLETATDKCEDAANVLESILIKNA